jgi:hypothetical protein
MTRKSVVFLMCVFFCMVSSGAMAANQNPSLNWGYTDVLDGAAISMPPGFVFNPKVATYSSTTLKDGDGHTIPGRNKLNLVAFAPQLIYTAAKPLPFGGLKWGAQVQWSIASLNVSSNLGLTAGSGMIGDVVFGPFIGRSHELGKGWAFHWFGEFDVYAPIGSYDKNAAFNVGANFWTFEPFLAMTLTMPYGFEVSTRQHYLWNTKNNDYVTYGPTGPTTHDMEAGQMWHMNFSASKSLDFISPLLRLGVVGYYGQQTTDDKLDSSSVSNSKERIFGIGPYLGYTYIRKGERAPLAIFSLKSYWESSAKARAEGTRVVFRMTMPF